MVLGEDDLERLVTWMDTYAQRSGSYGPDQERLARGLVAIPDEKGARTREIVPGARLSVLIFLIAIIAVVCYAMAISSTVGLIEDPVLKRDAAIMTFMLAAATAIALFCKIDCSKVLNAATFKSGMSACICVLGVAWLDSFNTYTQA